MSCCSCKYLVPLFRLSIRAGVFSILRTLLLTGDDSEDGIRSNNISWLNEMLNRRRKELQETTFM